VRPFRGHLHSIVPLASALQSAGHLVAVATGAEIGPAVKEAGLQPLMAGMHTRDAEIRFPGENPAYGFSTLRAKIDDLLEIMQSTFRPNIIIRESTDLAASIAAEVVEVPCLTFGVCTAIPLAVWLRQAGAGISQLRADYGLPADPELGFLHRTLYIDVVPPSVESLWIKSIPNVLYIRYEPWDGGTGRQSPAWVGQLPDRPTVLVTLGTVYNKRTPVMRTFLDALEDEDINVICTLGDDQPLQTFLPAPANVRIEQYLPHSLVLSSCDALLCHGGFNSVMGALSAGVPVVCVPQAGDQFINARRASELGFGIELGDQTILPATQDAVREAVRRVVQESSFRQSAEMIRAEIEGQVQVSEVVGTIEKLAVI
jgi:UDP:flavonoid glycosyltransferase YjiC (YdhE family)